MSPVPNGFYSTFCKIHCTWISKANCKKLSEPNFSLGFQLLVFGPVTVFLHVTLWFSYESSTPFQVIFSPWTTTTLRKSCEDHARSRLPSRPSKGFVTFSSWSTRRSCSQWFPYGVFEENEWKFSTNFTRFLKVVGNWEFPKFKGDVVSKTSFFTLPYVKLFLERVVVFLGAEFQNCCPSRGSRSMEKEVDQCLAPPVQSHLSYEKKPMKNSLVLW